MNRVALAACLTGFSCLSAVCVVGFTQGAETGVYTAAQAARAATTFTAKCAVCHGAELTGGPGTPPLKGPEFQYVWKGKSAAQLVAFMRDKMPPGGADKLSDQQYTDIVALIMQANDITPGAVDLSSDDTVQNSVKLLFP